LKNPIARRIASFKSRFAKLETIEAVIQKLFGV
jgi:hypothetical protein